ncbi:alcohol dehydrogenase [candidate division WOR_3 bacterium SM1_77]|jgi:propanol-preferring alcohol dehydrogenase|uniref:alcohol dehydrogenase n=1 Tax=candidate division WOR_3 bacterium SM1_77 TaxID=1703778 RepID=A0A0S8JZJ7_UNCW3|nr:MAG: alcohol dehydrogenase [candidate division WOR_3 bacterium SM1_77]
MKAIVLDKQESLQKKPLNLKELPIPEPGPSEVRIRVSVCGVCRTDLHVVEGELPAHKSPLIPGHQIVGKIDKMGEKVTIWRIGERVGVPWLHKTCGKCKYCLRGQENLCAEALFTGYDVDGGFAAYTVAPEDFVYRLPDNYADLEVAPLLCAGVIGYQAFSATGLEKGRLGLFGFGSSAHIIIQVAVHKGLEVYVVSRTDKELALAKELGAKWVGHIDDDMGILLDAGIVFAPSGELLVKSLTKLDKGGRIVSAGIYTTPLPGFDYSLIYPEKCLTSIAHTTRDNVRAFLKIAAEFKIRIKVNAYGLEEANQALLNINNSEVSGSTVLKIE